MSQPTPDDDLSRMGRLRAIRHSESYKTTTLLVSAFIIAVIILGAIYVAVTSGDDEQDTPRTPAYPQGSGQPSAQSAPPTPTTLPPDAFGIPTTDLHGRRIDTPTNPLGQVLPQTTKPSAAQPITNPDSPLDPPTGLMWQRVNGVPLPFSTSDGPTSISEQGVPDGFAHTPQGAVLAAWHIYQRAAWGPLAQTTAIFEQRAVITDQSRPVADRMINGRKTLAQLLPQLPPAMFDVPAAVKVSNYDNDYAHIQIAMPVPTTRPDGVVATSLPLDVVWRDNTWKYVVPNDGVSLGSSVTSLGGWSQW